MKSYLPRGLYGRAALILIVPIVAIQLVVSMAFIQRHFEGVTQQMTEGVMIEVAHLLREVETAPSLADAQARGKAVTEALDMAIRLPATTLRPAGDQREVWDLSGKTVIETLRATLPNLTAVDLIASTRNVEMTFDSRWGPMDVTVDRKRVSATNPHQLLVLMIVTSLFMTLIAFLFLSNQLRPVKLLGEAATAFGRGHHMTYRPRGALEVRAAGSAFLDMRARIERQIEQRTLMLSGVSHDLRSPLTRLRLGLSMLPDDPETQALLGDVADMERLVDEFLSFARGDAMEDAEPVDPVALVHRAVENAGRTGLAVSLGALEGQGIVRLRPAAVMRALDNLIGNAVRYGTRAEVGLFITERAVRMTVEDDGPGIAQDRRDEAMTPFSRLDGARDPNRGGGVGLGLSIAADIARSHGGVLRLGESETMGGLKAELVLAR